PSEKPLKEGDIVNVDVTLILDGWHGDSSRMYAVGTIPRRADRLIEVTYEAMMRGISVIRPGATTGDIGAAIQSYVEGQHMSVVRTSAATVSAGCFTTSPISCMSAAPAKASCCGRACSSRSSR